MFFLCRFVVCLCIFTSFANTDLKSQDGKIEFDVNSDGLAEATLNSNGFGVGTIPNANLHISGNAIFKNNLFISNTEGHSNLHLAGSMSMSFQNISANTQLGDHSIVLVDTSSDNINISLPSAANTTGRIYRIKKVSTNSQLWVSASDNIDGFNVSYELTNIPVGSLPYIKLISNDNNWLVLNHSQDAFKVFAADNLVAWLKFDETSGSVATDSSVYSHSTTLRNGLTFSDNGVTGLFNRALDFEGNDDLSAQITSNTVLNTPNAITVSAWVYPTANSSGQIVRKNNEYLFRLNSSGTLLARIYIGGAWSSTTSSSNSYTIGQWNHLVMRWDGSKIEYFINGQLDPTSISVSGTIADTGNLLDVGGWSTSFPLAGIMDEFRVYNSALSDSEIIALSEQRSAN